ncbi:MAG: AAA family ATPase, partial [Pseudomonadota bacterium]
GLISNMQAGRGELLHWVLMSFNLDFEDEPYVKSFKRFQDFVVDSYAAGRRVLLIVDEAQNLSVQAMEELRMLSNINSERDELLQIILMGQPQLRDKINSPELTQFAQRISADYHLGALNAEETAQYIDKRLEIAGATEEIFPPRTCELIHQVTGGTPRLINTLCDMCLAYGYADDSRVIDESRLRAFLNTARERGIYNQFTHLAEQPKLVSGGPAAVDGGY